MTKNQIIGDLKNESERRYAVCEAELEPLERLYRAAGRDREADKIAAARSKLRELRDEARAIPG